MKVLETLSKNIAKKLKQSNPDSEIRTDVLEYGLVLQLNKYGTLLLTCFFGAVFNQFYESIAALVALGLARRFSGGIHCPSLTTCMLATSLFCIVAPMIVLPKSFIIALSLIAIFIFIIRAPNWFEEFIGQKNETLYKIISTAIVSSNLAIQSSMLTVIFFVQALTLLPANRGDHVEKEKG